ncbi:hypothetical protein Ahy_B06g082892 [Arachis hypogaea]|uniref:Putative plant transposon protein domain-containing protein n=1 Tax=Arachis hypogaea TaxID=3818 RepID=A0A444YP06_ARAHY|nr:hypothetical protein Ahy_B06g082892 [Arachis hypogaea]
MAPPRASSSKKRKTKEPTSESSRHNDYKEINNKGWALLCNPPRKVVKGLGKEFYANSVPQPGKPYGYLSYVRGKAIDYSPSKIERMLMVKQTSSTQSYEERMKQQDPGFDEILNEICVLNVQWINDQDGRPNQLSRRDLSPQARGLCDEAGVEKIIDEVLVDKDKPITAKKMAKVVAVNPPQTAREHRAHAHVPQEQPQQEEGAEDQPHYLALQLPPYQQYQQFLEGSNWEKLQGDIHQMRRGIHHLREDVNQLKDQQKQWD